MIDWLVVRKLWCISHWKSALPRIGFSSPWPWAMLAVCEEDRGGDGDGREGWDPPRATRQWEHNPRLNCAFVLRILKWITYHTLSFDFQERGRRLAQVETKLHLSIHSPRSYLPLLTTRKELTSPCHLTGYIHFLGNKSYVAKWLGNRASLWMVTQHIKTHATNS